MTWTAYTYNPEDREKAAKRKTDFLIYARDFATKAEAEAWARRRAVLYDDRAEIREAGA